MKEDLYTLKILEIIILDIVREVEVGGIYYGEVIRLMNFGAFIDLGCGGKEGLLHRLLL